MLFRYRSASSTGQRRTLLLSACQVGPVYADPITYEVFGSVDVGSRVRAHDELSWVHPYILKGRVVLEGWGRIARIDGHTIAHVMGQICGFFEKIQARTRINELTGLTRTFGYAAMARRKRVTRIHLEGLRLA